MSEAMNALRAMLAKSVEAPPRWLVDVLAGRAVPPDELALVFGAATHDLGRAGIRPNAREADALREAGAFWAARSTIDEVARVVLLHTAVSGTDDAFALVRGLFGGGDSRERAAILRALALLPDPLALLAVATEGCRTNVRSVFEAIACENTYPARWFPDLAFRQMVLKAVFIGVPIARIDGVHSRTSDELRRMARDYASERLAAGRSVPEDVQALLASSAGGT